MCEFSSSGTEDLAVRM